MERATKMIGAAMAWITNAVFIDVNAILIPIAAAHIIHPMNAYTRVGVIRDFMLSVVWHIPTRDFRCALPAGLACGG